MWMVWMGDGGGRGLWGHPQWGRAGRKIDLKQVKTAERLLKTGQKSLGK